MRKQIILIMVDTQRTDMVGCYGNPTMKTPNIDKLARLGLRYTNAQTTSPVCAPARGALFTGLMPHSNGIVTNSCSIYDNIKTVGQRLNDNGIHCGYVGKWHVDGGDYFGNGTCPDGWDENYWYEMKNYLKELSDDDRRRSRKSKTSFDEDWTREMTYAHRCSNRSIDFINKFKDEDFFLTLSYDEPHGPCICPAPYNTMYNGVSMPNSKNYADDLSTKPLSQQLWSNKNINKSAEELQKPTDNLSLFLGCNSFVDDEIGRVLETIYEQCPDAIIIYTADHGDMLFNHKLNSKNCCAYKEVLNIPFIVKGGAVGVVDYPTTHLDVTPTILDYMNVEIPPIIEGKSIMAQIKDGVTKINNEVYSEFTRYELIQDGNGGFQPMRCVFDGRYKLVINLLHTDEFYDLERDPDEVYNAINDPEYKEIREALHEKLIQEMDRTRDVYRGYQWAMRPWRDDKTPSFRNAGYVRQREESEMYEERQFSYDTGLPMEEAVRIKIIGADKKA
ncbi:sulfatase [Candidatus Epulonipiscium fishelsonii]|uniref:Sulfatase n=1 Tax=Candidatus Epulonipiscium fishelsonii TaxID=77094 RepID=A0ACC8X936_9FIRM|nr:sulfatase [Epulopiscium sp. SCG-B11WGA-EpuloA1]ONI39922.1 sulfatase [Epulopiscium sp. SCG-B05WGA-EpuloA1]